MFLEFDVHRDVNQTQCNDHYWKIINLTIAKSEYFDCLCPVKILIFYLPFVQFVYITFSIKIQMLLVSGSNSTVISNYGDL